MAKIDFKRKKNDHKKKIKKRKPKSSCLLTSYKFFSVMANSWLQS